jgi:hypothetical protein
MPRISILLAATLFGLIAASASNAGPIVAFTAGNGTAGAATNINNGKAFPIALNATGSNVRAFVNNTGNIIEDFHFTWTNKQNKVVGEDDFAAGGVATAFGSFTAAATTLDFFDAPGGAGIGKGATFTITISGLDANKKATVLANATFKGGKGTNSTKSPYDPIPEPTSLTILVAAIIGLARGRRRPIMPCRRGCSGWCRQS